MELRAGETILITTTATTTMLRPPLHLPTMAPPTRSTMRLLSPRLQHLRQPTSTPALRHQLRHASSRYSNPTKRTFTAAPSGTQPDFASVVELQRNAPSRPAFRDDRAAFEAKRQYHLRRMRFAGMGLLLSIAATAMIIYNIDLDDLETAEQQRKERMQQRAHYGQRERGQQMDASGEANEQFQGKEVHVIGAGEGKRIVAQGQGQEIELIETGTSSVPHFPKTIYLPSTSSSSNQSGGAQPNSPANPGNLENQEQYMLVGLGIRTVMWIQVYVVGLYIRTKDISTLQDKLIKSVNPIASTLVPAEKDDLRKKLLDPAQSRELWNELLQTPGIKTAWRVSPTRNTDFGHLRDGFVTGIQKRTQEAKQLLGASEADSGSASGYDSEEFGQAVAAFKGIFQGGKAPKGSILLMCRDADGALDVLFQPKPDGKDGEKGIERLGSVSDERIGRLIWLGYLAGEKVSSEAARKGVVEGCVGFAGRPVGSAETMVG